MLSGDFSNLASILLNPFFQRAILGLILTSLVATFAGPIVVSRGMGFLTAAISHSILGGAALGILVNYLLSLGIEVYYVAVAFGILAGVLIAYGSSGGPPERIEVSTSVVMAIVMSSAVLLIGFVRSEDIPKVWGYLIGDILILSWLDISLLSITAFASLTIYIMFHKEFFYIALDAEGAEAVGLNVRFYHYISIITASLAIAVVTKALGSIVVYAVINASSSAALALAKRASSISLIIFLIVLSTGLLSVLLSFAVNLPPSGLTGILISLIYFATIAIKKKGG